MTRRFSWDSPDDYLNVYAQFARSNLTRNNVLITEFYSRRTDVLELKCSFLYSETEEENES